MVKVLEGEIERLRQLIVNLEETPKIGRVQQLVGLTIEADGPRAHVGELVEIRPPGRRPILAEVVGFKDGHLQLVPLEDMDGVGPGSIVESYGGTLRVPVGEQLRGRILDGLGRPIDGLGPLPCDEWADVHRAAPHPLERQPISEPISLGVKAIDATITCGMGQRLGIFAGSGVGKSTLLGMIARGTTADVNVIALIGERGREVRDFIERDLGKDGLRKSVVIAATSDQSAMMRIKGAFVATAIAEYFRHQGLNVLLMMDSVTRFAYAQREIGLAAGEPPATKGYTPSVFALLPKLLERTGSDGRGTITGLYTVLVDGDDLMDPIADAVRSILDGHVVLSRQLAEKSHFPAIDVLASVSRAMLHIVPEDHYRAAQQFRSLLAAYNSAKDLIDIGAYVPGANPMVDRSIALHDSMNEFLRQDVNQLVSLEDAVERLKQLVS